MTNESLLPIYRSVTLTETDLFHSLAVLVFEFTSASYNFKLQM